MAGVEPKHKITESELTFFMSVSMPEMTVYPLTYYTAFKKLATRLEVL